MHHTDGGIDLTHHYVPGVLFLPELIDVRTFYMKMRG